VCRDLKFHLGSANGLSLYLETGKKRKIDHRSQQAQFIHAYPIRFP
jgi:hypothetical protein